MNVVQPSILPKPYMVTLKIIPSEKGKINTYVIDSGSPINIIRDR